MQTDNSFNVVVRKRVPYITTFLFNLLMVFTIALLLLSIIFVPTKYQSDEMKVAYFILVIPDFVKNALMISGVGFLAILPLYTYLKLYKKATLTFLPDGILIDGEKIKFNITVDSISKVFCMDSKTLQGDSKHKLTLYFERKTDKTIRVRLKDYSQADVFMNQLMKYEGLNLQFYDFDINPESNEDNTE